MKNWKEIHGFFGYPSLFERAVKYASDNSVFVEIGAWMGRSTCCMGQLIKESGKHIKFYSIDTWEGSAEHSNLLSDLNAQNTSLYEQYCKNLQSCNVVDFVIPIQGESLNVVDQFEDESIDFLHIDAAHDYDNVIKDIKAWFPKVKPGGIISGDDYEPVCWGGVVEAVNEYFKNKSVLLIARDDFPLAKIWYHKKHSDLADPMQVTLYAIAKNEENNIEKFLKNAKKFDDVVVVDTGSTDNTVKMLKDSGIKVFEHPQNRDEFDFSVARNQALSYVETEWAFSVDFNEQVDDYSGEGLGVIAGEFTRFNHQRFDDNEQDGPVQSNEVHVRFHRTKNYKWVNAVHEVPIFVATDEFPQEVGVDTTIKITKKINKTVDKELFYFSICEREHKKDPKNWYWIWFIFNHYYNVQNLQKSLDFGLEYLNVSKPYFDSFRILALIRCSQICYSLNEYDRAIQYAFHAFSESMMIGGQEYASACFHLFEISKKFENPNLTVFVTALNPEFKNAPERTNSIDKLFLTNIDDIPTCWRGHRRFAEWLVLNTKPDVIVDLGVDWGFSTFCFAMPRCGHVYGIDTFEGDNFTGNNHGSHEYVLMKRDKLFMNNNVTFIKGLFDDVAKEWDKKIDILHIDGDHAYESVKHDYETWSPFLNENGIILFHDTCIEELNGNQYGVKKFFDELEMPKVTFTHTFGLGIASYNKELIEFIKDNMDLSKPL